MKKITLGLSLGLIGIMCGILLKQYIGFGADILNILISLIGGYFIGRAIAEKLFN